jgi:hypothetical protein
VPAVDPNLFGLQGFDFPTLGPQPDAPTLAVADLQSGTGATATITTSTAGSSNAVSYLSAAGASGGATWTLAGTRTGDGTLSLSLPVAYYWFRCDSTVSGLSSTSNLVYSAVSDNALAVHERALLAIQARIQGLTLDGLPVANVYAQLFPNDKVITLPCVLLTLEGLSETQPGTLTGLDDIGYPVRISICARNDGDYVTNRGRYLLWRQQIARALRNQRLSGVTEVFDVRLEYGQVVDRKLPAFAFFVTGLTARAMSREIRG